MVLNPMSTNAELLKEFTEFVDLFDQPSKHKKIPHSSPKTLNRIFLTQLTAILTDADTVFAQKLLDSISTFFLSLLKSIAETDDPQVSIQMILKKFSLDQPKGILSASRSCIQAHIPRTSKTKLDEQLEHEYEKEMQILDHHHAKSRKVALAIDMTHEKVSTKYKNNQHSYVRVGQRKVWETGFNYSAIYDITHQKFLGFKHFNEHITKNTCQSLQPWILHLQEKIEAVERQKCHVELIEADRGYYNSEFFALSHIGALRGFQAPAGFIRVMTPTKFTAGKEETIWNYLLMDSSKQVSVHSMQLNFYSPQKLRDLCKDKGVPYEDGYFNIPVAQVVLVDEYQQKLARSFETIKMEAIRVQKELMTSKDHLKNAEEDYLTFQARSKDKSHRLKYRKSKRRKLFTCLEEGRLYNLCYSLYDRLCTLESKKQDLLHSVAFFTISLASGEDPVKLSAKFIKLAQDYHGRWEIENGFRDTKYQFLHNSRTQKSTRRQFYWILGLMLYNRWERHKGLDLLKKERDRVPNIVPWNSRRPHMRKKLERMVGTEWSAKFYLLRLWENGLNLCAKTILEVGEKS